MVVGARAKDVTLISLDSGAAYVFARNQGGPHNWGEVRKLKASDFAELDNFGCSVSVSGDTAVVGARGHDDGGTNSGSAYVFGRNKGGPDNWGEVKKLTASDAAAFASFGSSVSVSGDTAMVGAAGADDVGTNSGSAYVFARNQGGRNNWAEARKLIASDAAAGDLFGFSVSVSGDTAVVGAPQDDDGGTDSGSAYVFGRNHGGPDNWGEVKKLTAQDAAERDLFGLSVSVSGDTAIVGVPQDDDGGTKSGSAYVFRRNRGGPGNWGEAKKLAASDATAGDEFGISVSVSGDTAILGARGDDDAGGDSGSAYVLFTARRPIPALSECAVVALASLLVLAGALLIRRRVP